MATYAAKGDRFEENTLKSFAVDEKLVQYGTHEIPNSEVLTLYTDNDTHGHLLLPAPGAGKLIEVSSLLLYHHYLTAAFNAVFPGLYIGEQQIGSMGRELLEATEDYIVRTSWGTEKEPADELINQPLYLWLIGAANPTSGGGSLSVRFTYRIYDFN